MPIYKTIHQRYTAVDNVLIHNVELSWKAKGILIYLLSKKEDWEPRISDIVNHATEGRDAVRSGIKELREFGYMKLVYPQNSKGQMEGSSWYVSDEPIFNKPEIPDNRQTENPYVGNANTNKTIDKQVLSVSKKERSSKKTLFANSGITADDWKKYFKEMEEAGVDIWHYFNGAKDWSDQANKKRTARGWYATGRTWMRRDKENNKLKMKSGEKDNSDALDFLKL